MSIIPIIFDLMHRPQMRERMREYGDLYVPQEWEQLLQHHRAPNGYDWISYLHPDQQRYKKLVETNGAEGFELHMNVEQFKPSEICVKVIDRMVVVEAKHDDRQEDQGFISRHFVRKYPLPKEYDPKTVVSSLSSDGVLSIKAPPQNIRETGGERIVQIQQTGLALLNLKTTPVESAFEKIAEKK